MANILEQAITKIKAGDQKAGRQLLGKLLKDDPYNEQAWFWLSRIVELDEQRRQCLENVLKLNPDHEIARLALSALPPSPTASLPRTSPLPVVQPAPKPVRLDHFPVSSPRGNNSSALENRFIRLIGVLVIAVLLYLYVWRLLVFLGLTLNMPASAELVGCRPACQGVQLPGARLVVADLREVDLHQANLHRADLGAANLSGANLSQADLSEADLKDANLSKANLSGANLRGATLRLNDLRGAKIDDTTEIDEKWRLAWEIVNQGAAGRNLSGVDLSEADLSDANLSQADLSGAILRHAYLNDADLSEANLSSAFLREASLLEANLYKANLYGAQLYDADLTSADLREANLSQTQLQEASLIGADLRNANLSGAFLRSTFLINPRQPDNVAKLDGADFSGANLQGVYFFSLIDWSGVKYDSQTLWPAGTPPHNAISQ